MAIYVRHTDNTTRYQAVNPGRCIRNKYSVLSLSVSTWFNYVSNRSWFNDGSYVMLKMPLQNHILASYYIPRMEISRRDVKGLALVISLLP